MRNNTFEFYVFCRDEGKLMKDTKIIKIIQIKFNKIITRLQNY